MIIAVVLMMFCFGSIYEKRQTLFVFKIQVFQALILFLFKKFFFPFLQVLG